MKYNSPKFHSRAVVVLGALLSLALHVSAADPSPDQLLARLMEGNARFVSGKAVHPDQTAERRKEQAKAQTPFAVVVACADSRVAPEIFFDQGIGDLFVIRNAGNVLDDHVLGSIEYACEHLHVKLVVIAGHDKCGAVTAAVEGGEAEGHIRSIVEGIAPDVAAKDQPGDRVASSVRAHARHVANELTQTGPFLKEEAASGKVKIVAACYDVDTGKVEILK